MSFFGPARAALVGKKCLVRSSDVKPGIRSSAAAGVALIGVALLAASLPSCGGGKKPPVFGQKQNAYVTLPSQGSVLLMQINSLTGAMTTAAATPEVVGTSPKGLALMNKFLYVANSQANTISLFNIASDGTLSQNTAPTLAGGSGPHGVVVDPSGKYLLVTNTTTNNISVFSIDSGSGALTPIADSPFYANSGPGEILFAPSGDLVYVTNSGVGTVTGFTFSNSTGELTSIGPPNFSGAGASGMAVDNTGTHLYVANTSAINNPPISVGNISGFNINQTQGASYGTLAPITGSPFTATAGSGPSALARSPNNFLFATTPGGTYSVWVFTIAQSGVLTPTINSPFSVASGGLFALLDNTGNFFYIGSPTGIQGYVPDQNTGQPVVITGSPYSTNGTAPGKMVVVP
jgi:6-phosphogluconolactonase (cycloisomerase 2 family)